MAYSTYTDVRRIIATSLLDPDLTALIILADQEINDRNISGNADIKKTISMLFTAAMAAMKDPKSTGIGDYKETINTGADYRFFAEGYINKNQIVRVRRG